MTNATIATTIRPDEAAHFGALAADWWSADGSSAMLHKLNPVRLGFIRNAIDSHWGGDTRAAQPLDGKRALDAGCGAGLLCEPLSRLGARVTGVDAAAENIQAAKDHAGAMGLGIDYRHGELGKLGLEDFDLVCSMEVLEHVADKPTFIAALAGTLADDGLMILSVPNRTPQSRLVLIEAAEGLGKIPRGTHCWDDFVTPDELHNLLAGSGLAMGAPTGISWSPLKGLHLSDDLSVNFIVTAKRA